MNPNINCSNLDSYLDGELSAAEAESFAIHLHGCVDCRESIAQQRWIEGLLRSPGAATMEAPPTDLAVVIRAAIAESRQRAGAVVVALAAAAALLLAVGWQLLDRGDKPAVGELATPFLQIADSRPNSIEQPTAVAAEDPRVTVITGPDSLAVPIESPYPDVTIVRIYPTYQPEFDNSLENGQSNAVRRPIGRRTHEETRYEVRRAPLVDLCVM